MPTKNVDQVYCKLIGLSCLKGELSQKVSQEWESRFYTNEAFWHEIPQGQTAGDAVQQIARQISEQGIYSMNNMPVIAALFLDLTENLPAQQLEVALETPRLLSSASGCKLMILPVFGYLGTVALVMDKNVLRQRVSHILEQLSATSVAAQLCMIADPLLNQMGSRHNWKAALIWLDALRRNSDPLSIWPSVQNLEGAGVGFIRYGEYDERKMEDLHNQSARLKKALEDTDDGPLYSRLEREHEEILRQIEAVYPVNGNDQPIHPDMNVSGCFNIKKTRRGMNPSFNAAQARTQGALQLTAERLRESIEARYLQKYADADQWLDLLFRESEIGVQLEEDGPKIRRILLQKVTAQVQPNLPPLSYCETGYAASVGSYLEMMRAWAAEHVWSELMSRLLSAYQARTNVYYEKKRTALAEEKKIVDARLGSLLNKQALIDRAARGADLPEADFYPTIGGGAMTRLLFCRNQPDAQQCDKACMGSATAVYCVDEKCGGLKTVDSAPVKALQILMMDPQTHLDNLIK